MTPADLTSMKSLSHRALYETIKEMAMEKNQCPRTIECAWTESSRTEAGVIPTPITTQNQGGAEIER